MRAIDDLVAEHGAIEVALGVLDELAARLERGETGVPLADAEALLDFIRGFADRCHHAKEEELLFPAMAERGVAVDKGPIGAMLADHEQGRAYVRAMAQAVEKMRAGDSAAGSAFAAAAHGYVTLLRQHIAKENQVLFPMAERRLTPEQQAALVEGFERIEEERVGHGKHEEYHRLLERLQGAYVGAR